MATYGAGIGAEFWKHCSGAGARTIKI